MPHLERRLRALEGRDPNRKSPVQMWVRRGDGYVYQGRDDDPNQIKLTEAEFDAEYPDSVKFTIKLGNVEEDRLAASSEGVDLPPLTISDQEPNG